MSEQRIGVPVRWKKDDIKGDRAELFVYDPKQDRWSLKKEGPNDEEFLVSFPQGFKGRRHAIVIGSEGGLANVEIEVK